MRVRARHRALCPHRFLAVDEGYLRAELHSACFGDVLEVCVRHMFRSLRFIQRLAEDFQHIHGALLPATLDLPYGAYSQTAHGSEHSGA